ncbi:solute carrier family 2, facilitated glucose transporter member 2 [Elysia marginata]|uniref:Solute carrier family 2, facilitated glucose transporter member 2 n=1 Tax=Elysia marginata TaxID=1093978 RepID=A0AAV4EJR8_9GAST|nr:solute carrier family 2, facilitated glucose transporter member 2 [Elysia marginata]
MKQQKRKDQMEMLLTDDGDASYSGSSPSKREKVVTFRLALAVTGAALGSFPFGYNLGSINAPESLIRDFIDTTQERRDGTGFTEHALTIVWALTAAIFAAGGCLGAAGGGWWATKFGRRDGSLLASSLGVVAGVLMLSCRAARAYELIIIGRFIVGIQCGLFTALTPLYLAEISPVQARGAVGVLHQLALVTGMLTAQVLGFPVLLGTERCWHILLGLTALPSFLQALILPFSPESPRYLLTARQDSNGCRQALEILRGSTDVETEMNLLVTEKETDSQDKPLSIYELLMDTRLRQPLMIGVVLHLSQQVNGIPGVFFYSTRLFQDAGLSEHAAKYTTSGLGVVMVTMGVLTVPLMDRAGRRTLLLIGLGGMAVMAASATVTLCLRDLVSGFDVLSIILILILVVFFALGPAPVPWLIVPELFTHDARPAAVAVCVFVNWTGNFVVGFGFPLLQVLLQDFVFLPFAVALAAFYVFVYFKLPETKGKSFQEITILLNTIDSTQENYASKDEQGMVLKEAKSRLDQRSSSDGQPTPALAPVADKGNVIDNSSKYYGSTDHLIESDKIT